MLSRLVHVIRSRLFYKMLIIYSLLTLVPLAAVSTVFYVRSDQLMEKKAAEEVQQQLNVKAGKLDELLYSVKKRLLELGEQGPIRSLLAIDAGLKPGASDDDRRTTEMAAVDLLQSELEEARLKIGDLIDHIYLVNRSGDIYATDKRKRLQYVDAFRLLPFEFKRVPEWAFFTDYGRMACDLKIYAEGSDASPGTEIGLLILTFDPGKVQRLYEQYDPGTFYITNSVNMILSSSDLTAIGTVLDVRSPGVLVVKQKSQYAEYQYVALSKPGAGTVVRKNALFALTVALAAWITVFIVTYWILKRVTNPINRLTRLMRKAEREEYQLFRNISTRDEIAMLCRGYNQLVQRTEELIEKNYKSELRVREAELNAIRMHINPHFLYNILEYISILSQSPDKAKHVPAVVQQLSGIFRFSITPGNIFVPLETELLYAEKFLQIHQCRFGDRLGYTVDLPVMFRSVAVPRLILQPLVENCIIHGIDRLPQGGRIDIGITEEQYQLVIRICNHMPEPGEGEKAGQEGKKKGLGSGLENVDARIKHHFGNGYGVSIACASGMATVTLRMPIQIWQEESA